MKLPVKRIKDQQLYDAFCASLSGPLPQVGADILHATENHVEYALWRDEKYHQQFVESLRALVQKFEQAHVSYVLIKTEKRYPYDDSNIDIVCETPRDAEIVRTLAAEEGRVLTKSFHEPDKEMYRRMVDGCEQKPGWHLHPGVTWNGVSYLSNQELFAHRRRVRWEGATFFAPSLEYDLLIHAAHTVFENFQITLGEFYDATMRATEALDWDRMQSVAKRNGWGFGLQIFLSAIRTFAAATQTPTTIPTSIAAWVTKLRFPLRYPMVFQLWAFSERIIANLQSRRFQDALRECYAYPAFYLIEKFKHVTHIRYP